MYIYIYINTCICCCPARSPALSQSHQLKARWAGQPDAKDVSRFLIGEIF